MDIGEYKVMTGRHHHISEIVLKGIINNIDYVVSLQKDAKNFIKDIYGWSKILGCIYQYK